MIEPTDVLQAVFGPARAAIGGCNFGATAAPTVNADISEGYDYNSIWYKTTATIGLWICTDPNEGAAVWKQIALGTGGVTAFTGLSDVPSSYSGQALKVVRVNAGATGLEFVTLAGGGDMLAANNLADLANAATARTNLGVAIGTNVQAFDADLSAIAGLTPANDDIIQRKAGAWTNRTIAQLKTDLAYGTMANQNANAVAITGGSATLNNTGLKILDTSGDNSLGIDSNEDLTSDRVLQINVGDGDRVLSIPADATIRGTNTGDQTSIVGITGTKAQFDTAVTDGNFLYVGDAIGGTLGTTDNAIPRADGVGGVTAQGSLATIDDSGSINIPDTQIYKGGGQRLIEYNSSGPAVTINGSIIGTVSLYAGTDVIFANGGGNWAKLNNSTGLALGTSLDAGIKRSAASVVAVTDGGAGAGDLTVADEAYDATAWNGSLEVPTKNAVRDKFESLSSADLDMPETGSLTVATAKYHLTAVRHQCTGSQRITVAGTGRLRIQN